MSPDYAQHDLQQTAFMFFRDFANDTLQLEYDLNDHVTLTGGVIFYQSGDLVAFRELEGNDRIFFEYMYAF